MTPEQCKAARALLRWTVKDLSDAANVGVNTISFFEARSAPEREFRQRTILALRATLEAHGVEFLDGAAPGVRLHGAD
ncbi:MAG: helix-turn-helix transcriptional regulator [Myxococcales bacterium]|nr:helix-turn-helix transcriptional regulator [Myxococcales bacterium]